MSAVVRWASVLCTAMLLSLGASSSAVAQSRNAAHTNSSGAVNTAPNAGRASQSSAPVEGVVNINTATEDELQRLPRVGPSRAQAIVALRARVQRFRAADDLLRVRGIGRASMRRLRPYVTLTGDTTLLARPGRAPRAQAQPTTTAP